MEGADSKACAVAEPIMALLEGNIQSYQAVE
jgi:hypothetical protein